MRPCADPPPCQASARHMDMRQVLPPASCLSIRPPCDPSMLQSPSICCSIYLHGVTDRRGGPSWRPDAIHVELQRPAIEGQRRMCPLTGSAAQQQPVTRVRILLQQLPTLSIAQLRLDLLAGRLRTQASRRPEEGRTLWMQQR